MFCIKFPIRILLACLPKFLTKARNFLLNIKLLFLLFEITFLNVSYLNYIFGENVKREKLFPIEFSIGTLITVYSRSYSKKAWNLSTKGPKKEVRFSFLQNNINMVKLQQENIQN